MTKPIKITITSFIILLVLGTITILILYPLYTDIVVTLQTNNPYTTAHKITTNILTKLSPTKETFAEEILGETTIEETLETKELVIDTTKIEELNTTLTIETINVFGNIYQGKSSKTMDKGFWHYPLSTYPGEKGNMVIIGHRYLHIPPATDTFYNLDKVKIGDKIVITNNQNTYNYIVTNIDIVEPNNISVLQQTTDYRLTLITCTPLWTSDKRLVITANLDKLYKKV